MLPQEIYSTFQSLRLLVASETQLSEKPASDIDIHWFPSLVIVKYNMGDV